MGYFASLLSSDAAADPVESYILLQCQRAEGTSDGQFTLGAWRTRTLTHEVLDTANQCTLASNQFTLLAGTYFIRAYAPVYTVNASKTRLQNITDGTTIAKGTTEYGYNGGPSYAQNWSKIVGLFTIAATKTFEIQHFSEATKTANGFGVHGDTSYGSGAIEIYTFVELWS